MRGPGVLTDRPGTSFLPTRRERFDNLVLGVVTELDERWRDRLGAVEYAVEEAPVLPDDWDAPHVPLASVVPGPDGRSTRLVVFRRPIEHRCGSRLELEALVLRVVVEELAELLAIAPEDVDPRYPEL